MSLHALDREPAVARDDLIKKVRRDHHLQTGLEVGRVDVYSPKHVHVRYELAARHHVDGARGDERLVEPPELVAQTPDPPPGMRSRRPHGVFEDGIIRIEREPPRLVVLSGEFRRGLGFAKKGVAARCRGCGLRRWLNHGRRFYHTDTSHTLSTRPRVEKRPTRSYRTRPWAPRPSACLSAVRTC